MEWKELAFYPRSLTAITDMATLCLIAASLRRGDAVTGPESTETYYRQLVFDNLPNDGIIVL